MTTIPNVPLDKAPSFRAVYEQPGRYDDVLLRHFFGGREDTDLVAEWMAAAFGPPPGPAAAGAKGLRIAEFGCGTGRVTDRLAPYARQLLGADYSPAMTDAFQRHFPQARALCADTRDAVAALLAEGFAGHFDLVGAFWSLSYPLGACFESLDGDGIRPAPDPGAAHQAASAFVSGLVDLLAPGGHLLALLFDSDSPEQRLVTWAWERIAPTPFADRAYTRTILVQKLLAAEAAGRGNLTTTRLAGVAVAEDRARALRWFTSAHFKDLPKLVLDPEVIHAVNGFVTRSTCPDGTVVLPAGVHVIDFHRGPAGPTHLPADRQ